jgi:hypothetical protein
MTSASGVSKRSWSDGGVEPCGDASVPLCDGCGVNANAASSSLCAASKASSPSTRRPASEGELTFHVF